VNRELAVAVSHLSFLHAREKRRLYRALPGLDALSRLSRDDIADIIGRRLYTRAWNPAEVRRRALRGVAFMRARRIDLLFFGDAAYPPWLAEIYDPPFVLFVTGAPLSVTRPMLSVVGTRTPTHEGRMAARTLGAGAARAAIPLVSGLARGIDAEAHRGAVEAAGRSVAVLGCGIDTVYPAQNRMLARSLLEAGGTIVSEYPPGTPPRQYNFPERNRIISGLSRGVVVVEAPERSGALITADYALEQGRDLFVHRVAESSPRAAGARSLVADGASLAGGIEEIVAAWELGGPADGMAVSRAAASAAGAGTPGTGGGGLQHAGVQLALDLESELNGGDT
jgi:DNA processing protein